MLSTSRQQQRGFTLVEMMVTAVILFLLAGLGVPAYQNYLATGRQEAVILKVNAFTMFEKNYFLDNNTYKAGTYQPGGTNDFKADLGYEIKDDHDGIGFTVEAGACGKIESCYRVIATTRNGEKGTFEDGAWTW